MTGEKCDPVDPTRANFFFGPTSDLENFSRLVNLPFLGCVYFTDRTGPSDRKFLFSKPSV